MTLSDREVPFRMWLFLAFVALPLIEIALFVTVGGAIGLWPTLAIVIGTAFAGVALMRRQGARTLAGLKRDLDGLRDPAEPIVHGALILLAGALLVAPGFFTDTLGLLLLVPPLRGAIVARMARHVIVAGFAGHPRRGGPDIIDGEFHEIEPGALPPRGPSGWTRH